MSFDHLRRKYRLIKVAREKTEKCYYERKLDTEQLLRDTSQLVAELREGHDKLLRSQQKSELVARAREIAAVDAVFLYAEKLVVKFKQNSEILRQQVIRADNIMNQIELLKQAADCTHHAFQWLHQDFSAPKDEKLFYFLLKNGLRTEHELPLNMSIIRNVQKARKDPEAYILEIRKSTGPSINSWTILMDKETSKKVVKERQREHKLTDKNPPCTSRSSPRKASSENAKDRKILIEDRRKEEKLPLKTENAKYKITEKKEKQKYVIGLRPSLNNY